MCDIQEWKIRQGHESIPKGIRPSLLLYRKILKQS